MLLASLIGRNLEFSLYSIKLFLVFLFKLLKSSLLFCELCFKSSDLLVGELIVIVVIVFLASVLEIILDVVYCLAKLKHFLVLCLKSLNCIVVALFEISGYVIILNVCLKKLKKFLNCEVKKLLVGKLGVSLKNSCDHLCVTGSNVPLLSSCDVRIKNLFRNLTGNTLLLKELHKLVGESLFNLLCNLCVLAVNVNVNGVLAVLGIHKAKINCSLGKLNSCVLCGHTLKLNLGENNLAVLVNCVCGNYYAAFVGDHFDFGVNS